MSSPGVVYTESKHTLYYVPTVNDIKDPGVPSQEKEDVTAYQLTNNVGMKVKAMARGANLVVVAKDETNYVWENIEGATYYGGPVPQTGGAPEIDPNAFPLKRGLILNGGIRYAAVTAEHGLYYDIDWDEVKIDDSNPDEKSIYISITDNEANRQRAYNHTTSFFPDVKHGFSGGQFNRQDINSASDEMTKYPITNMTYVYKITLRKDEEFVRLNMSVINSTDSPALAEAWLPMTFPITQESTILSEQVLRWRRDTWCFEDLPNMVPWASYPKYDIPLDWPTSGIFYDFPKKDGLYHGVVTDPVKGQGVVYIAPDAPGAGAHYTKMWSWGDPANFDRQAELEKLATGDVSAALAVGRPASEYYEPWSSGSNFAFFQTSQFQPQTKLSWEVAIMPISSGLTGSDKDALNAVVADNITQRQDQLEDLQGISIISLQ